MGVLAFGVVVLLGSMAGLWALFAGGTSTIIEAITPDPLSKRNQDLPLGIDLKNPFNLRPLPGGKTWQGQTGIFNNYCRFSSFYDSTRAGTIDYIGDIRNDGDNTLFKLINKQSPASDGNPVEEYVAYLSARLGILPTAVIDWKNRGFDLMLAIGAFEQGEELTTWIPFMDLKNGYDAGIRYLERV